MVKPSDAENEMMVPCKQCLNPVWVRKDRLDAHLQKVHSPKAAPKKSFTTYKARLASTFPPKVVSKATRLKQPGGPNGAVPLILTSRVGQRVGPGRCLECGAEELFRWHYSESNQGAVEICSACKPGVFERSFG